MVPTLRVVAEHVEHHLDELIARYQPSFGKGCAGAGISLHEREQPCALFDVHGVTAPFVFEPAHDPRSCLEPGGRGEMDSREFEDGPHVLPIV